MASLQNPVIPNLSPADNSAGADKFSSLIALAIQWMFIGGILIFILFFLISAFKWITSQGDKNSLESARQGVLHSIIGLVVIFALFAVLDLIGKLFGFDVFHISIPVFGGSANQCTGNQFC